MLYRFSAWWARCEVALAAFCAMLVTLLILVNVVTRAANSAIFWIDEAAIYTMIWMTFLAASAAVHHKSSVSVSILVDLLPRNGLSIARFLVDLVVLTFAVMNIWFCWIWFNPAGFWASGFDIEIFQGETFNFIYAEPTNTLGIGKAWVWMIMPIFALGFCLHAISNVAHSSSGLFFSRDAGNGLS
jgi:TRAP-type C4-dicarboxylate transport system permease small subunit